MARQAGPIKIKGTICGICFYQLGNDHYARKKSSLSGKRVKTGKAFRETMRYARLLAKASVIGSFIYRQLPIYKRDRKVYQCLTGQAMQMLKEGLTEKQVIKKLQKNLVD
ncbi:hypothetical protein [Terrimonas pollutisoli]|uniref:hypothetical protein n=1 Tax=Terrimonas pollutisoli TaxID=3034147 RepID=UPI0023EC3F61|nr:hypothetical protein [Terrimonas sp. H1YJ31]